MIGKVGKVYEQCGLAFDITWFATGDMRGPEDSCT
jgi:hypothetical protein